MQTICTSLYTDNHTNTSSLNSTDRVLFLTPNQQCQSTESVLLAPVLLGHIMRQLLRCSVCLQCFDAVGWAAGRASGLQKTEWLGAGVVICLEQGADLHMTQLMPLPLTVSCSSKIQIGFTILVPAHLHGLSRKNDR